MKRREFARLMAAAMASTMTGSVLSAAETGKGTSVGQPGRDDSVSQVPAEATRYWYAAPTGQRGDMASSVRRNAWGDPQSLYYDLYPPLGGDERTCAVFVHGGGFVAGHNSDEYAQAVIDPVRRRGCWVASVEYRRGWETRAELLQEMEMSVADVAEAWNHLDAVARPRHGFVRYVPMGRSAGAVILSRLTLARLSPVPGPILGLILGYGAPLAADTLQPVSFPVVLQGGLFDAFNPAFDNYLEFDASLDVNCVGYFNLYRRLRSMDVPCHMHVSAQDGHGFGVYADAQGQPTYFADALTWFKAPTGPSWKEYRFRAAADPHWTQFHPDLAYPGAGGTLTGLPDSWSYAPYEDDLAGADGPTPAQVAARRGVDWA